MSESVTLWPTQIGLFDSRTDRVMIHRKNCRMVNTTRPRSHVTTLTRQQDIDDMLERGYRVLYCKCCKNV